ncbi:MAG: hypothetical protein WAM60_01705 [Candidatus Promineifilaceae bacterium]
MKSLGVWVLVGLISILAACGEETDNPAVSSTPTLETPTEQAEEVEALPLPPIEGKPSFISVSQFPISVVNTASAQHPAFISIEMAGFDISQLTWQIGHYGESCNRLVGMGVIAPDTGTTWTDGIHQANFNWPAVGYFLGDNERADFVYLEGTPTTRIINGRFRQAITGETMDTTISVDPVSTSITGIQSTTGEPQEPVAGDGFQLYNHCMEADGSIRIEPGVELIFLEGGQLTLEQRPLASGDYFLHLTASGSQNSSASTTDFPVNNDALIPDSQVYLNTAYGFQFLYPVGWQPPQEQDTRVITGDSAGSTALTVTVHPDMAGQAAGDLKSLALSQFGDVTVLFEDQVSVGDTGALWTAYGYTGADGPHTGILLVFTRDGTGYTVDMDGLESAENQTINLMDAFAKGWSFRPDITAPRALEWVQTDLDGLTMPVMATYYKEELDNGWQRFTIGDGISFMAVRTESLSAETTLPDSFNRWRDVIGRGATDLAISNVYTTSLNGRDWLKTDFKYTKEDGLEIQGLIMAAEIDNQAVIFWSETPINSYEEQSALFLLSLAGLLGAGN